MTPEQQKAYLAPLEWLEWQGHRVYSRSAKRTGFVYRSQHGSHPEQCLIMVRFNGMARNHWREYTMDEARADLIPGVTHLIREEPFLPAKADNLESQ